ncbi:hypothetical protein BN971_03255 [Mycobacterium bohemicum DSM 44277]|uniref:Uncharacterized protein n=1 Tax=Mycobacterium bohemicum DSM 44277 TaxID=1236609 RepID=A0A0U0WBM5_MYCBE|nr:hypothetical protein [Mycobacterium bohemicum]MCV6968167.1 hypothetical protein [Mycobacterium bohemicum]CPR11962.1 hypothetical protein BN971_03255 [Mycobacterium bohemicum DSM 44277]
MNTTVNLTDVGPAPTPPAWCEPGTLPTWDQLTEDRGGHRDRRVSREMSSNWVAAGAGKVRAICEHCGRRSRPVESMPDGRPTWDLPGWSSAPYPVDVEHRDGSHGTLFTCPGCRALADGRQRSGITPLLSPAPERAAAIRARVNR